MEKDFFSYIRVSTVRQGERGVSLQEQQDAILRYAQKNSLRIARSFEERETAAKRGRPVFSQMIRSLRRNEARGVVIHKIDRGARNLKDWADLGELIDTGVEVHFANESLDLNTRGGRLSADIQAVVAADYIRNLREEAKKGIYGRLKQGIYPMRAPIGYTDRGAGNPKVLDPKKASLIQQAFQLYASGNYALPRLADEMYNRGLRNQVGNKVTLNGLSTIMNNPFYTGVIRIKKTAEFFPGKHEPLISTKLFEMVQHILRGKTVPRVIKHDFVFRKLARCLECNATLIAEVQKKHVYYRCHTAQCDTKTMREERIDSAVAAAFAPLRLDAEEMSYVRHWMDRALGDQERHRANELETSQLNLAKVRDRLGRLTDAYLDGAIDKKMLEERKGSLLFEEAGFKKKVAELESGSYDTLTRLKKFLELVQGASNLYKMAIPLEKRDFIKNLTSNLSVQRDRVAVKLKNGVQLIANRRNSVGGGPSRGVHRTWEPILTQLLAHFEKELEIDVAPVH